MAFLFDVSVHFSVSVLFDVENLDSQIEKCSVWQAFHCVVGLIKLS